MQGLRAKGGEGRTKAEEAAKKKATKAEPAEPSGGRRQHRHRGRSGERHPVCSQAAYDGGDEGRRRAAELQAIRLMVSAMTTKQKEDGVETLSDEKAQEALAKLAKMRKESIEMFEKGGNKEAAEAERFELTLLEEYLPAMADEATVRGWIATAIEEACPDGPDKKLMGKVMGALMKAHKGEFDGKVANKWVGEMLAA